MLTDCLIEIRCLGFWIVDVVAAVKQARRVLPELLKRDRIARALLNKQFPKSLRIGDEGANCAFVPSKESALSFRVLWAEPENCSTQTKQRDQL